MIPARLREFGGPVTSVVGNAVVELVGKRIARKRR